MTRIDASLIRGSLFLGGLLFFLLLELVVPYRSSSVSKAKRRIHNLALTLFNSLVLQLLFAGTVVTTAVYVTTHQLGVLNLVALSAWAPARNRTS